jgi:hypothetical protein
LDTYTQKFNFTYTLRKRHAKLILGMAGTPAAAELGSMIQLLRSEVEKRLQSSIRTIGIAFPNGALISRNEVNDALAYAGLQPIGKFQTLDYELNAAYGANDFGFCPFYTNFQTCEEEEDGLGVGKAVLQIDYTSNTLAANA